MPVQLKAFLQRWIIIMVAVLVATHIVPGIHYDHWQGLLIATFVLGLLNAFLKPVLLFLSLPLVIVTFGLFTVVINALLLYMGRDRCEATGWPDKLPKFGQDTPLGRAGQPAELAGAYVYLASDDASYTSGAILPVTGGKPL